MPVIPTACASSVDRRTTSTYTSVVNVRVAEVLRLGPVGVHQPVVEPLVQVLRAGMFRQAERSHRVRDDIRIRVVLEPVLLEERARARHPVGPVAGDELLARDSLRRVLGVQVERQPLDGRAEALLHPPGQHLADAAERSDVVRPDDDLVLGHCQTLPAGGRS